MFHYRLSPLNVRLRQFVRCENSTTTEINAVKRSENLSYEEALRIRRQNLNPAMTLYYKKPIMISHGRMQYLNDVDGKRYLDFLAGIVTVSVGHCHPEVNEAAKRQIDQIWHTTTVYLNSPTQSYAEKLLTKFDGYLNNCYFTNSGYEANDLAILLAKLYTNNHDVIALRNAYHGLGSSIMPLTSLSSWKHKAPISINVHTVTNPDPYKGPWGGSNCRDSIVQPNRKCSCQAGKCDACEMYLGQLEDTINHCVPKNGLAAIIIESIQGAGGSVQFPRGFVKRAFEMARKHGAVCISDEVQTGFGRTGEHFWGYEMHGAKPDIVVMAKGIANGFPMGALVTRKEIASSLGRAQFFNTFGGNPLACVVASKVLDVIEGEKLQQNSLEVGSYILRKLAALRDKYTIVGDVRGKGLMIGVELVEDKESKKPLNPEFLANINEKIKDYGLLVGKGGLYGNVIRIKPPMCITMDDADFAVDVIEKSIMNI